MGIPELQHHQHLVSKCAASPGTGLFKGFGTLSQQAETAVSGNAGNRSFESLYIQRHCLPSSATADSQALLLIIFLLLFHQSGITKELFPGRNSQFVVDILVVKL